MSGVFNFVTNVMKGLPGPLVATIVFAVGLVASRLARFSISLLLRIIRIDSLSEKTGITEFLRKGHVMYAPSSLAGILGYWIVLIITLFQISRILDIGIVNAVFDQAMQTVPMLLAAIFVSVIGSIIVAFFANFAMTLAGNAALPNAKLLSRLIKYGGNVLVIVIALDQVGLGRSVINSMFILFFGALMLGLALAFGLGCKDMAREALTRYLRNLREREEKGTDLEG